MKKQIKDICFAIPWLVVGIILVIGVVSSVGIYHVRMNQKESTDQRPIGREGVYHEVTFLKEDGSVLEEKTVADCDSVMPPMWESTENKVFRGWSMNLSGVTYDFEAQPMVHDISELSNVFHIDTRYEEGGQKVWIELKLGGQVNLSSVKLVLAYDPKVLKFLKSETEHEFIKISKAKNGNLEIIVDSQDNLMGATEIAKLQFRIADVDFILAHLNIAMFEPRMMDGASEVASESTAVDGKIYIY